MFDRREPRRYVHACVTGWVTSPFPYAVDRDRLSVV